ncbi:glycoside hydrolase family 5 protein [Macrolepiota fuliginosa MF-IS2]|uniref:Glycoside hydrolase family 5 protein n=1 Tax=Macrolepiota fuliginosa MF-IS2 TaxID=1400762 RepID=A0A9P6C8F2_9AGAR|nr:glycoside hydrolase family 5 protein [Macrolepiota fuliginosa MF-IS2]
MTAPMSPTSSFIVVDNPMKPQHPSKEAQYKPGFVSSSYAHNWSSTGTGGGIRIQGRHFVDAYGRICNLRGVNLSGCCKTPVNHTNEDFPEDPKIVTFVGRPFPLSEAHEHFSRLRRWGMTFIRFLVTWEAVEHEGPGIYDQEYLTYLQELLSLLPKYGISAYISVHQDVWSRYTGGSGAPAWTVEAVGFDLDNLEESGAAWLGGMRGGGHTDTDRGLWPTGYQKLAASTMGTVFWGGDVFAPKLTVKDGVSIQQFLQNAFLDMWGILARAVGDLEGVIGFQMINEPHRGYIDLQSMYSFDYNTDLHLGPIPSPFQSFQLGAGHPTLVPTWTRSFPMPTKQTTHTLLNEGKKKAWKEDGPTKGQCLWEMHGVWGWCNTKNQAVVLRENYFVKHPNSGKKVDWYTDLYYPFLKKWAERVLESSSQDKILFVEPIPNEFCPTSWTEEHRVPNMVYAPHWYCLYSLFNKSFGEFSVNVQGLSRGMFPLKAFYWGHKGVRDNFSLQIRTLTEEAHKSLGDVPVLFGECGIPMDMNKGEAFISEDFIWQKRMMDAMITGLDRSLVGFNLWNYNPDNTDAEGDHWNGENFSWFSQRRAMPNFLLEYEQTSPHLDGGGRILDAVVRPYPAKVAGIPLEFHYEMMSGEISFSWVVPEKGELQAHETEIFFPSLLTAGRKILLEAQIDMSQFDYDDEMQAARKLKSMTQEKYSYTYDETRQTLFIVPKDNSPGTKHGIRVKVWPPVRPLFNLNDFWSDFGIWVAAVVIVVIGVLVAIILGTGAVWFGFA